MNIRSTVNILDPIIEEWLWENVGPGGWALKPAVGCEGFDDEWDGDMWQYRRSSYHNLAFKEESHAIMFLLRWA